MNLKLPQKNAIKRQKQLVIFLEIELQRKLQKLLQRVPMRIQGN